MGNYFENVQNKNFQNYADNQMSDAFWKQYINYRNSPEGLEIRGYTPVMLPSRFGTGASGRHVKMISQIKDGKIWTIEAKGKKYGIVESPLTTSDNIITIRRIVS